MLHPIHTPLHCQHQANTAYDKLAVISENMPKIQEIEQFIFELRQWLRAYLEGVKVDFNQSIQDLLSSDNNWTGSNTFINNNISMIDGDIYWKDDQGNNLAWVTYDAEHQILTFHAGGKEIQLKPSGSIAPTTNPDLTTSIITLDYLSGVLSEYQSLLTFDDAPTDGSPNPVTSDGIYEALQDVIAMIPDDLTIDDTVTEESENPVTSGGIYSFITSLINAIPSPETYVLPKASTTLLGGIKVGDYLVIDNSGVLSVDYDSLLLQLRTDIGLTEISDAPYGYVSKNFSQLHSSSITSIVNSGYSLMSGQTGTGNNYLNPVVCINAVGANGELTGPANTTSSGVRLYTSGMSDQEINACRAFCKNNSTNVSKTYLPIRTVIIYNGVRYSQGGNETGGLYWQNVQVRVWYRDITYTLTAEDITSINNAANTFAESLSLGVDTGDIS